MYEEQRMPHDAGEDRDGPDALVQRPSLSVVTSPVRADARSVQSRPASAGPITVEAYERHAAEIHAFVLRIVRDGETAADIVADAFTKLFTEEQAGRTPVQPRPWLYRVAANLATSRGRRMQVALRATRRLEARGHSEHAPSAERELLDRERDEELHRALERVTVEERTALLLAAAGHDGETIAAFIGKSHAATRTLMCRARRRLRTALQEQGTP
jgi:RNA polymerase sigma-70 factor (ECF subfamily)